MNETVTIALIVLVAVLVSLVGLALVRRFAPTDHLAQHTEVAGYVYAVIGVTYAVVLALIVIAAWEEYWDARVAVADEASAVLNLARAANGWPSGNCAEVESALVTYARQVVDVEWPALAPERDASYDARSGMKQGAETMASSRPIDIPHRDQPREDGFFGPDSVTWRLMASPSAVERRG